MMKVVIFLFLLLRSFFLSAQNYIEITGTVIDSQTHEFLENASVSIRNTTLGTYTNSAGEFTIFFPDSLHRSDLTISIIGYSIGVWSINSIIKESLQSFGMEPGVTYLKEVVVQAGREDYARLLLSEALRKLSKTFTNTQTLSEAFYREVAFRDSTYVRLIEAAVTIHDFGYTSDLSRRRVKVEELRKSEDYISYGWGTKLSRFFFGNENMLLKTFAADFVRRYKSNPKLALFDTNDFVEEYLLALEGYTKLGDDSIAIIKFNSNADNVSRPYYEGRVYINLRNDAVVKMDYGMFGNPKGEFGNQSTVYYQGDFFFKVSLDYKEFNGQYYLSRILMVMPVNFDVAKDGKGQQFASYDLMINNIYTKKKDFDRIRRRDAQRPEQDLYSQQYKYNESFWRYYNIVQLSPLLEKMVIDLEKKNTLEEQFKKNDN